MTAVLRWASRHALLLVFAGIVAVLSVVSPSFRSLPNLVNIVEQQSIIGVVACGMLLMILLGGFDLSVGAVGAATSVLAAWTMASSGIVPGIFAALALGAFVGLVNGVLVALVGINPFVATLGMQTLVTGILFVLTNATPVYGVPESFTMFGLGRIGLIPWPRSSTSRWPWPPGRCCGSPPSATTSTRSAVPARRAGSPGSGCSASRCSCTCLAPSPRLSAG